MPSSRASSSGTARPGEWPASKKPDTPSAEVLHHKIIAAANATLLLAGHRFNVKDYVDELLNYIEQEDRVRPTGPCRCGLVHPRRSMTLPDWTEDRRHDAAMKLQQQGYRVLPNACEEVCTAALLPILGGSLLPEPLSPNSLWATKETVCVTTAALRLLQAKQSRPWLEGLPFSLKAIQYSETRVQRLVTSKGRMLLMCAVRAKLKLDWRVLAKGWPVTGLLGGLTQDEVDIYEAALLTEIIADVPQEEDR